MAAPELPESLKNKKIALIHDWLVSQRGGENVLDAFCELFPTADVFTLVHKPGSTAQHIERAKPKASLLRFVPGIVQRYRYFLPLMPWVIERFDLTGYDLILSSSHCVAKGVRKPRGAKHVCYIHAPMRYMWDRYDEYFSADRAGLLTRLMAWLCRPYLQWWDRRSAKGVDLFIANSRFIAGKVKEYYQRDAQVIHPFCELDRFLTAPSLPREDFYLMVTALVPYKRVDLAIEAFNQLGKRLLIVGDGPDLARLKKMAQANIEFLGALSNEKLVSLYQRGRGLLFPGVEDFGIVPLEAMASGMPVIAFGQGGVLETVQDGKTGLFFHEPTSAAIGAAIIKFEALKISADECKKSVQGFSRKGFQEKILTQIQKSI